MVLTTDADHRSVAALADANAPIGELIMHAEIATGNVEDIDAAGLTSLGYRRDELIGRPILEFVHPDDHTTARAAIINTVRNGFGRCVVRIRGHVGAYTAYSCICAKSSDDRTAWIRAIDLSEVARTGEEYWQYARLGDLASDHFVVTDRAGNIVQMNRAACELYGLTEQQAIGRSHQELAATPEGVAAIRENCRLHLESGEPGRFPVPVITANGEEAILECITLWDDVSQRWYTIERNITEQVEKDRELAIGQRFFDSAHNPLALLSASGRLKRVNPAFEELVGHTDADLVDECISGVLCDRTSLTMLQPSIDWVVRHQQERRVVVNAQTDHGERMLSVSLHPDPDDTHVFFSARDITEEIRLADELKDRATHDQLTRLPTREAFNDALESTLRSGWTTAVLMLDIDDFKHVNDSLGHDAGDELLIIIGARLRATLRSDDVVARFGGDEFVALIRGARSVEDAAEAAEKVRQVLSEPYRVANREVHVSASVGVSVGNHLSHTASQLLSEADTAAYEAKHRGRNRVQIFGPELAQRTRRRIEVERHLRAALDNEEIGCDVQAVFDVATGAIAGVEVFARMEHPTKGRVGPGEFLDVARQLGLLAPLGERVIDLALRTLTGWLAENPNIWISFNVDGDEVAGRTYSETLRRLVKRHRVNPAQVVIELDEVGFADPRNSVSRALDQLVEAGFRVCVDDFGAASTSLGQLRSSRVQRVKVDLSSVHAMVDDPMVRTIVNTIVDLGRNLGVEVAAEGVETQAQADLLADMGCNLIQGHLLRRPIPIEHFLDQ